MRDRFGRRASRLLKKSPSRGLENGFLAVVECDFDGEVLTSGIGS